MIPPYKWTKWAHPYNTEAPSIDKILQDTYDLWAPHIKPGFRCVDVGAYTGDTALPMAMLAGPTGQVIAIESNAAVFPTLLLNSEQEGMAPIYPVFAAASGYYTGPRTHHYCDPGFCNGGELLLGRDLTVKHTYPQRVWSIRFEEIIGNGQLDFIKLDTEGHDLELLNNIADKIAVYHPTLQVEIYPDMNKEECEELIEFLEIYNYTMFYGRNKISPSVIIIGGLMDIIAVWTPQTKS